MSGVVVSHFRQWLRAGMTQCEFAKLLPGQGERVMIESHVAVPVPPIARLNVTFDTYVEANRVAVAVFPRIAGDRDFVELLNEFAHNERWTLRRRPKLSPTGCVLVGLEWRTADGDSSDAMGFGPMSSMPVPRRAPYFAIAAWLGSRSNPFRGCPPTPGAIPGQISFLDAAHGFEMPRYERLWTKTTKLVAALMSDPPDDPRLYRRATFVVPEELAAKLQFAA